LKKLVFIALAVVLALSIGLVGCGGGGGGTPQAILTIIADNGGKITLPSSGDGRYSYDNGTTITVTASPYTNYTFAGWTGSTVTSPSMSSTTVVMDGDKTIQANFNWTGGNWDWAIPLNIHYTAYPSTSLVGAVFNPWKGLLNASSGAYGGTWALNVSYGPSPWDSDTSLTAVSTGISDIGQISIDTFHLGTIGYLPFMFPNMTSCAYASYQIFDTDYQYQTWQGDVNQLKGIKVLLSIPLYPNELRCKANITSPDLQSLNIRCEAGEVPTIEALNGIPKLGIDYLSVGQAMNLGTVDGAFLSYDGIVKSGACNYSNFTTITDLYPRPYILGMTRELYKSIPPEARALIDAISGLTQTVNWTTIHEATMASAIATLNASDVGNGFGPWEYLNATQKAAWVTATAGVYSTWAAEMNGYGINGTALKTALDTLVGVAP